MNRKDWSPTAHSVICIDHFEEKIIKSGKKCKLFWQLHPVPTIHHDSKSNPPLLRTPIVPRKSTRKRKNGVDELDLFQAADKRVDIDSISEQFLHEIFTFKRLDNNVQLFSLKFNEETGIPAVHKCISIDRNLHGRLLFHGLVIPRPEWLRYGHNCTLTKFNILENFSAI